MSLPRDARARTCRAALSLVPSPTIPPTVASIALLFLPVGRSPSSSSVPVLPRTRCPTAFLSASGRSPSSSSPSRELLQRRRAPRRHGAPGRAARGVQQSPCERRGLAGEVHLTRIRRRLDIASEARLVKIGQTAAGIAPGDRRAGGAHRAARWRARSTHGAPTVGAVG